MLRGEPFTGSMFKSDLQTRVKDRTAEKRAEDKHWLEVCLDIEHRDGMRCRACGRRVVKTLTIQTDRLEHHHVIPISLGGPDEVWNIACLCLDCHEARHVGRQLHITGNANDVLDLERDGKTWRSAVINQQILISKPRKSR